MDEWNGRPTLSRWQLDLIARRKALKIVTFECYLFPSFGENSLPEKSVWWKESWLRVETLAQSSVLSLLGCVIMNNSVNSLGFSALTYKLIRWFPGFFLLVLTKSDSQESRLCLIYYCILEEAHFNSCVLPCLFMSHGENCLCSAPFVVTFV